MRQLTWNASSNRPHEPACRQTSPSAMDAVHSTWQYHCQQQRKLLRTQSPEALMPYADQLARSRGTSAHGLGPPAAHAQVRGEHQSPPGNCATLRLDCMSRLRVTIFVCSVTLLGLLQVAASGLLQTLYVLPCFTASPNTCTSAR